MKTRTCLVTGSSGLIGSEVCVFFAARGWRVHGVDNNQRAVFFGPAGDTRWNQRAARADADRLPSPRARHPRPRRRSPTWSGRIRPDLIVHAAAQPSPRSGRGHSRSTTSTPTPSARSTCSRRPGSVLPRVAVRASCRRTRSTAIGPNTIALRELPTRWDYDDPAFADGIPETFSIDQSKHSLFGASKVAADVMVQEYGRYFGMPTCCLRGGCLTGPNHSGVELHGFLSYLVQVQPRRARVQGLRLQGQAGSRQHPRLGRRRASSTRSSTTPRSRRGLQPRRRQGQLVLDPRSVRPGRVADRTRRCTRYVDAAAQGDHICYYSDLRKMKAHYPGWDITRSLPATVREIVDNWHARMSS